MPDQSRTSDVTRRPPVLGTALETAFEERDPGFVATTRELALSLEEQLAGRGPQPTRSLTVVSTDGYPLAADLYLPTGPARARLLLGPAMGVRRRFYGRFLADFAKHGIAAMVVDYRGIGGSRDAPIRTQSGRLSDWGERDLTAATNALLALDLPTLPSARTLFVGHSAGGQVFGLMKDAPYDAALFVGSQSGYWGHWDGLSRAAMAALWFGAVPLFTSTLGYLPMRALGQGENIPAGVAREWATWGRSPEYIGVRTREVAGSAFTTWAGRLRTVAIADDPYAPARAVRGLGALFERADVEQLDLHPRDVGARRLGHFGWFDARHRETLWAGARGWLLGGGAATD